MTLVELIVQGFGLPSGTNKVPLKDGLNYVQTSNADFSDIIKEVLLSLFFRTTPKIKQLLDTSSEKNRSGLTFRNSDHIVRLVKDFSSGAISLSELKDEKQFSEISKDKTFIREFFATRLKLPEMNDYAALFCIGGTEFCSQFNGAAEDQHKSTDAQYFEVLEKPDSSSHKMQRLQELKQQLASVDQLQSLEFKMDEIQQTIFEKEEKLEKVAEKSKVVEQAELDYQNSLDSIPNISIPEDVVDRIQKYKTAEETRRLELGRLEAKADTLTRDLTGQTLQPVHKNKMILFGIAGFLVFTIGSVAIASMRLPFLAGVLLSITTATVGFIQQTTRQDQNRKLKSKLDKLDSEKKSIEKKYDVEMSSVDHLMKRLRATNPDEILEVVHDQHEKLAALKERKRDLEDVKSQMQSDKINEELKVLQKEMEALRQKMTSFSAANFDPMSVRRDIEILEQELGISQGFSDNFISAGNDPLEDPLNKLTKVASKLLGLDSDRLLNSIKPGLETNLLTVSSRQFSTIIIDNGRITHLGTGKGGQPSPVNSIDSQELAFAHFALQFTLLQLLAKNGYPLPVLFLELPSFMDGAMGIIAKAVTHLSRSVQIVSFNSSKALTTQLKPSATL